MHASGRVTLTVTQQMSCGFVSHESLVALSLCRTVRPVADWKILWIQTTCCCGRGDNVVKYTKRKEFLKN